MAINEAWRSYAARKRRSCVRRPRRASAACGVANETKVLRQEAPTSIWTKRIVASIPSLCAKRGLGKQQLHDVVDDTVAAEDLNLPVCGSPCSSKSRFEFVGPRPTDGCDVRCPDPRRHW